MGERGGFNNSAWRSREGRTRREEEGRREAREDDRYVGEGSDAAPAERGKQERGRTRECEGGAREGEGGRRECRTGGRCGPGKEGRPGCRIKKQFNVVRRDDLRARPGRRRPADGRGEDLARIGKFIVRDEDIDRIKLELITFFKDNPGTVDSAERIGMRLGRAREEVERSLDELSEHGICYKVPSRPVPIYMYYATARILHRLAEVAPELDYNAQMELVEKLLARRTGALS